MTNSISYIETNDVYGWEAYSFRLWKEEKI